MRHLLRDLQFGLRLLFQRPGMTLLAIVALSLSIGMTTTAFSVLNGLFFKPLPFSQPEQLQTVFASSPSDEKAAYALSYDALEQVRAEAQSFAALSGYFAGTVNVSDLNHPQRYEGAFVCTEFSDVLRVVPIKGRLFTSRTAEQPELPEAIIGETMWRERYEADPSIIGREVRMNGEIREIIGILPASFRFPNNQEIWLPLHTLQAGNLQPAEIHLSVIGRLREGVSGHAAEKELAALSSQVAPDTTWRSQPFGARDWDDRAQLFLRVMSAAVIFILLISCANVANLLLGRASSRGRELAIRSALGATRGRLLVQMLTESLALAAMGALGGVVFAAWAVDELYALMAESTPYWINFALDLHVLFFVLLLMGATALFAGLLPAWQASHLDVNRVLKDAGRTATNLRLGRFTKTLAIVQVAFSCALLFGAGLTMRQVWKLQQIDPGFEASQILTMRMGLFEGDYPTEEARDAFFAKLQGEVASLSTVESAAVTSWISMLGDYAYMMRVANAPAEDPSVLTYSQTISTGYFETLGLPLVTGRDFLPTDAEGAPPVAIVNEAFADAFGGPEAVMGETAQWMLNDQEVGLSFTVVGVVPTTRMSGLTKEEPILPIAYLPTTQHPSTFMTLLVRTEDEASVDLMPAVRRSIARLDPHLPVYFEKTMPTYFAEQTAAFRTMARMFITIGLMALFLATVGVYGLITFHVQQRRREIGIRMAIGAKSRHILRLVLRQGFAQLFAGLTIGVGLALVVGKLIEKLLIGLNPHDLLVLTSVIIVLTLIALLAYLLPAHRATRLSLIDALRSE